MARRKDYSKASFFEVLTDAIADMAEQGYDSPERVQRWMDLLRQAAERTMKTQAEIQDMLNAAYLSIYRRQVDNEQVLRWHDTVEPFTLSKIKPQLRDELDKRILASADLIRLNREEAITNTLRRFSGWATSIPVGGAAEPDKQTVKREIKRGIAGLPFVERRVIIDQGHKLVSSISSILADEAGAIAGRWHSHWRQPGYNYREDHKERDELVYLIPDSWADKAGYVKPSSAGYTDAITQPGEEPFCRCFYEYLYSLEDLPDEMVTAKGRRRLEEVKAFVKGEAIEAS